MSPAIPIVAAQHGSRGLLPAGRLTGRLDMPPAPAARLQWRCVKHPLESVRPFQFASVVLAEQLELDPQDAAGVQGEAQAEAQGRRGWWGAGWGVGVGVWGTEGVSGLPTNPGCCLSPLPGHPAPTPHTPHSHTRTHTHTLSLSPPRVPGAQGGVDDRGSAAGAQPASPRPAARAPAGACGRYAAGPGARLPGSQLPPPLATTCLRCHACHHLRPSIRP